MNEVRFESIVRSLSSIERKVFECVPINEWWSTDMLMTELVRSSRSAKPDQRIVQGCLVSLLQKGLIVEDDRSFKRAQAARPRPVAAVPYKEPKVPTPALVTTPTKLSPADDIDRIATIAKSARALAGQLVTMASELDDVALDVEERITSIRADSDKLKQLQALLK